MIHTYTIAKSLSQFIFPNFPQLIHKQIFTVNSIAVVHFRLQTRG